jgi:ribose transport system substrate-binding protein
MAGEDTNIAQIKNGQLALSYDFGGIAYGQSMAGLLERELSGGKLDDEVVEAPLGTVYTKDNVDDFVPWTKQIEYAKIPSSF